MNPDGGHKQRYRPHLGAGAADETRTVSCTAIAVAQTLLKQLAASDQQTTHVAKHFEYDFILSGTRLLVDFFFPLQWRSREGLTPPFRGVRASFVCDGVFHGPGSALRGTQTESEKHVISGFPAPQPRRGSAPGPSARLPTPSRRRLIPPRPLELLPWTEFLSRRKMLPQAAGEHPRGERNATQMS